MPTYSLEANAVASTPAVVWRVGLLAAAAWLAFGLFVGLYPDGGKPWPYTAELAWSAGTIGLVLAVVALLPGVFTRLATGLKPAGPWLAAFPLLLGIWVLVTAKVVLLPVPFFAPPQALIEVFLDDWPRLGESLLHSLWLLVNGVVLGALSGFVAGIAIGWSHRIGYWVHPVLRILGPVPSTALLPICFFFFPTSWSASVFLIALATWFPVTVLTWSGVASVDKAYYEVARTLGANERFLVWRVAIPAALPSVFVGLFMGLGASFSVLVVAEMMGVKAGLGWYLQWAQGWAAYANMYAALLVMALLCSGLITLLFKVRDRVLSWQKGAVKW
jgi:NitT/TauT family transport system permease protein